VTWTRLLGIAHPSVQELQKYTRREFRSGHAPRVHLGSRHFSEGIEVSLKTPFDRRRAGGYERVSFVPRIALAARIHDAKVTRA
jgi:hypothetical protein